MQKKMVRIIGVVAVVLLIVVAMAGAASAYKVTYDKNGGTGDVPDAQTGTNITISGNTGNLVKNSNVFFSGWNTAADGNGYSYTPGQVVNTDLTLYAQWVDGYTELDYLESKSDRLQYINLGVNFNQSTKVEVVYQSNDKSSHEAVFGSRSSGDDRYVYWFSIGNKNHVMYGSSVNSDLRTTDTAKHTVLSVGGGGLSIDGTQVVTYGSTTFTNTHTACLFTLNDNGKPTLGSSSNNKGFYGKIYSCKVWLDGSNLSLNLVPCYRESDQKYGMYDTVAGTFYGNANTSSVNGFTGGYTMTYDANGGSGTVPDEQFATVGGVIAVADGTGLTKDNYKFAGWNTKSDGSGTFYAPGQSLYVTGKMTLYAKWIASDSNNFSVGYNMNDADSGTAHESQVADNDGKIIVAGNTGNLVKAGYAFGGWTLNKEGTGTVYVPEEEITIGKNTTLYAKWEAAKTVTLPGNSDNLQYYGSYADGSSTVNFVSGAKIPTGKTVTITAVQVGITKKVVRSAGWNVKANLQDVYSIRENNTVEFTMPAYDVVVTADESDALPDGFKELECLESRSDRLQYIDLGVQFTQDTKVEVTYQSNDTTSHEAVFGSRSSDDNRYVYWFSVNAGGSVYYGSQSASFGTSDTAKHTVVSVGKDGLSMDGTKIVTYGSPTFTNTYNACLFTLNDNGTPTVGATASNKGFYGKIYSCKVWLDGSALSLNLVPCYRISDQKYGMYDTVNGKFYGNAYTSSGENFTGGSYTVTYDANGGTGSVNPHAVTDDNNLVSLALGSELTRNEYLFSGWNTKKDGSGVTYGPGQSLYVAGNLTLYAKWEEESSPKYSLAYNANGAGMGTAPVDENNPYASGVTVTVLGNTGNLCKTGYNFVGWNTVEDGTGTDYIPGSSYTINDNLTLFAKWVPASYTFTVPSEITLRNAEGGYTTGQISVSSSGKYAGKKMVVTLSDVYPEVSGENLQVKYGDDFIVFNMNEGEVAKKKDDVILSYTLDSAEGPWGTEVNMNFVTTDLSNASSVGLYSGQLTFKMEIMDV